MNLKFPLTVWPLLTGTPWPQRLENADFVWSGGWVTPMQMWRLWCKQSAYELDFRIVIFRPLTILTSWPDNLKKSCKQFPWGSSTIMPNLKSVKFPLTVWPLRTGTPLTPTLRKIKVRLTRRLSDAPANSGERCAKVLPMSSGHTYICTEALQYHI